MAEEIERKFLVASPAWREHADDGRHLTQAYLLLADDRSLRVRITNDHKARLTLKLGNGLVREEFEYIIPVPDARAMIDRRIGNVIDKTRYHVLHEGFVWEVDVYGGPLAGLVTAEVELESATDRPTLPAWIAREVTGEPAFGNRRLAVNGLPESLEW